MDSTHTNSCFKAIVTGLTKRFTKLSTVAVNKCDSSTMDELYPKHFEALKQAEVVGKKECYPTLGQLNETFQKEKAEGAKEIKGKLKKRKERDRKRAIFLKIGFSKFWKEPVPKILKRVQQGFPSLKWLRTSMSYHRFTNLRELFQET